MENMEISLQVHQESKTGPLYTTDKRLKHALALTDGNLANAVSLLVYVDEGYYEQWEVLGKISRETTESIAKEYNVRRT